MRAEAEVEAAQKATHAGVVRAHYELANAYLDRIHGTGQDDDREAADAA